MNVSDISTVIVSNRNRCGHADIDESTIDVREQPHIECDL
jgi:hypothetical protein